jgi:site-specific DNA-cytosine methylase
MSRALGVYPVRINSKLVTAQLRDRYYWSNIKTKETMFDIVTDIPQPKDLGIMFKDIVTGGRVERVKSTVLLEGYVSKHTFKNVNSLEKQKYLKSRDAIGMCPIVYVKKDKANAMLQSDYKQFVKCPIKEDVLIKKRLAKGKQTPNLIYENELVRIVNQIEMERLQGFPDGYTSILSKSKAGSLLGDGWTLPVIEHIFNFIER